MTLIITKENLQDSEVKSKADAAARIMRSLAGRVRHAYELATGRSVDGARAIGPNPSGDFGVNCSGPPWGPLLYHSMAASSGIVPDATNFVGQRWHMQVPAPMTTSEYGQRDYQVWVMPYETVEGAPLGRMYPLIRMARTVDVTTTVTIRAENTEIPHSARSMSSSINALTLQTVQSTSLWVPTIPGRINRLRLRVDLDAGDGVGIASVSWGPRQAIRDL